MGDKGSINQIKVTGVIAYGWDGTNAYPIKIKTDGSVETAGK